MPAVDRTTSYPDSRNRSKAGCPPAAVMLRGVTNILFIANDESIDSHFVVLPVYPLREPFRCDITIIMARIAWVHTKGYQGIITRIHRAVCPIRWHIHHPAPFHFLGPALPVRRFHHHVPFAS